MHSKKMNKIKSAILSGMIAAVSVAGSFSAVAPSLTSSAASDNYAKLLQHSLYFYDANMCGDKVGETSALSWRDDCHTGDEITGGYHDAGDHVMFGLPQGYSASTLGWGYYEFSDAYNATGQAEHFKVVSDYFCTFFKNSTKLDGSGNVTSFLYQKGEGDPDHSYWGVPENQEKETGTRKMYWTSNSGSDIAAEYAAALALNYLNFGNAEDLKYAEALYKFSTQYNQVATDGTTPFYTSSSCQDEQAWAAGWLYIATGNESYKTDCANKQVQYLGTNHCWENVQTGAACVYAEITGDWSKVNGWLENYTNQSGYCFMSEWGSARSNTAMQLTALVASKHSSADYTAWAKSQMDFLLGNNPLNVCYVVGFDSNSAKNPHHRAASGMNNWDEFNASDVITNGHTLVGALVGGPKSADGTNYTDTLKDAVCNEVAVDYNAAFVGAAAGLYSTYKTGSADTSITGVTKIYNGTVSGPSVTTKPAATTTATTTQKPTQTTTTPSGSSSGTYTKTLNQSVTYSALPTDDKMIGWDWSDFNIPSGEKPTKVEIKISASGNIGKWQGAFGSSTSSSPAFWTQSDEMEQTISGNSGTITWDISSADSAIIQTQYGGQLKFGIWWIDCDKFNIDSITVYTGSSSSAVVTTASTTKTPTQTTTTPSASSNGAYELKLNQSVNYSSLPTDDKMIGWEWSKFGIPANEKPTKVEINISASEKIGKWQGAFGSSTSVSPAFWTQSDDMEQTFSGNSGTITWNISSADSAIIQTQYGGELKWGIWWIDCGNFTIDSIKVYTDGSSSAVVTTASTTKTPTQTTTTAKPAQSSNGGYEVKLNQTVDYSALPEDDKMIGWEWSKFNIPANEKPTKVEINISASEKIGKWQGAFGSSTSVSPAFWTQSDDMEQTFSGNSGTITWNISSADSEIIQTKYGGELKWGIWWIDCGKFTIDSIKVYTDGSSSSAATTTTAKPSTSVTMYGDVNGDGKVTVADAVAIIQYLGNPDKYNLDAQGMANADVDGVAGITANDALVLQKIESGVYKASDLPLK